MFLWIWQLEKQVEKYGGIDNLIAKLKALGVNDVCIKYHEGSSPIGGGINYKADFLSYAVNFKNAGFRVGTWGYNYFNNPAQEAALIIDALNNSDYYIFDPEVDTSNKTAAALQVCQLVRSSKPKAIIGYSSFPIVSLHQDIAYSTFNTFCDFASPQCYWGEMQWQMNNCINQTRNEYSTNGLTRPVYPSIQTYNMNYNDLVSFIGYGFDNVGFWSFDEADSTFTDFITNRHSEFKNSELASTVPAAPTTPTNVPVTPSTVIGKTEYYPDRTIVRLNEFNYISIEGDAIRLYVKGNMVQEFK